MHIKNIKKISSIGFFIKKQKIPKIIPNNIPKKSGIIILSSEKKSSQKLINLYTIK